MSRKDLTVERILSTIRIAADEFTAAVRPCPPRLAVLALNPHAGEGGLFGDEEKQFIVPAIETARNEGIDASGPHSADTLFWFAAQGHYDAVICMYHDQGLIPLKLLHFDDGVNVTLGLPIVRTSVDHGTAYDLAGTGKASPTSLIAAVKMADEMADKQEQGAGVTRKIINLTKGLIFRTSRLAPRDTGKKHHIINSPQPYRKRPWSIRSLLKVPASTT